MEIPPDPLFLSISLAQKLGKNEISPNRAPHAERGHLRESIKRLLRINKPKEEVLGILNESGFGEQGWGPV